MRLIVKLKSWRRTRHTRTSTDCTRNRHQKKDLSSWRSNLWKSWTCRNHNRFPRQLEAHLDQLISKSKEFSLFNSRDAICYLLTWKKLVSHRKALHNELSVWLVLLLRYLWESAVQTKWAIETKKRTGESIEPSASSKKKERKEVSAGQYKWKEKVRRSNTLWISIPLPRYIIISLLKTLTRAFTRTKHRANASSRLWTKCWPLCAS